jgi:putative transcriptional regulator
VRIVTLGDSSLASATHACVLYTVLSDSHRGQLLIASRGLRDPNFHQSVVLIVRHDEEGALGVVINRPLEVTVADACGEMISAASSVDEPLHLGGPCEGPLVVLHSDAGCGGEEVIAGVHFSSDQEQIESLMWGNKAPVKYIAGYSGWAPKQLETEIESGAWLLIPATVEQIFAAPKNQWSKLTAWIALGKQIDPESIPEDPSVN